MINFIPCFFKISNQIELQSSLEITVAIIAFGTECLNESITLSKYSEKCLSFLYVYAKITTL